MSADINRMKIFESHFDFEESVIFSVVVVHGKRFNGIFNLSIAVGCLYRLKGIVEELSTYASSTTYQCVAS